MVRLQPGQGHARHNHPDSEEILYIIKGTGEQMVEVDGEPVTREVGPGVLVHIPTAAYHSTVNAGEGELLLLAVYAPFGPEAFCVRCPNARSSRHSANRPDRSRWWRESADCSALA